MQLLPSIASADPLRLAGVISDLRDWPFLHIDVEDGNFTPNITFGMKTTAAICRVSGQMIKDVHFMVKDPCFWLEQVAPLGVSRVYAHIETLDYPLLFLNRAHELGIEAGLALNVKTPLEFTRPFWPRCDALLVMTAEPDNEGERLYVPAFEKAVLIASQVPSELKVYVDGALDLQAVRKLMRANIAGAVLGRSVFSASEPRNRLLELQELMTKDEMEGEKGRRCIL
jgi:ribulose-phosphate 3-epimerase